MALTVAAVTADTVTASSGTASGVTSFSPAAGEWVRVAFAYMFSAQQSTTPPTMTVKDSLGNTYTSKVTTSDGYIYIVSGQFDYYYASAPGSITVKVTSSYTAAASCLIQVFRFTGAAASQAGAATASASSQSSTASAEVTMTPTTVGSYVTVTGEMQYNSTVTPASGMTTVSSWNFSGYGDQVVTGRSTSTVSSLTSTVYGWTQSPSNSFGFSASAAEMKPVTSVAHSGSAGLAGSGGFGGTPQKTVPGGVSLSGSGGFGGTGLAIVPGSAALDGEGSLGGTQPLVIAGGAAGLSGAGSLEGDGSVGSDNGGGTISGSGSLGVSWQLAAFANLAGSGSLAAGGAFGGRAQWDGEGFLAGTGAFGGRSALTGTGTFGGTRTVQRSRGAALTGLGSLGLAPTGLFQQSAALTGLGTLGASRRVNWAALAALAGTGTLSIPQVLGGLVNGVGGVATPQALPGSSQVAVAPPGSANWQWLGTLGQVTGLKYSYVYPGGCDKMSLTLMVPATYRTQLFNPGWQVRITRGGHQVWDGRLDEPQPSASGWTLTAVGTGNLGANFVAFYAPGDTWPTSEPDEVINRAVARGLPWVNPGLDGSPYASQFWTGQGSDPGSQTVTSLLNLICTRGGLGWYVNSQPGGTYGGDDLAVAPLPTVPNRLLVCTQPVTRTLGGDINAIFVRYMVTADDTSSNTSATYNVLEVKNQPSISAHGQLETYVDLSDVGVMTTAQIQALCNNIFAIYQRASFAGPFTASYGQLLNMGGAAIDPGTDQAGTMMRLILTDFGYGGEVTPQVPVEFITGAYEWDDFAQAASITPYQTWDSSLTGMLSTDNTVMTPIAAASSS